jgi:hypothetical protein
MVGSDGLCAVRGWADGVERMRIAHAVKGILMNDVALYGRSERRHGGTGAGAAVSKALGLIADPFDGRSGHSVPAKANLSERREG